MRLFLDDSHRTFGGSLSGAVQVPPEHSVSKPIELEIRPRKASSGERLPIIGELQDGKVAFELPLWRKGRFEIIAWAGDQRSNAESFACRSRGKSTQLRVSLNIDLGAIQLAILNAPSWASLMQLMKASCTETPMTHTPSWLLLNDQPLQIPNTAPTYCPAGTLALTEKGLALSYLGDRETPHLPIASLLSGMELLEELGANKDQATLTAIEVSACE